MDKAFLLGLRRNLMMQVDAIDRQLDNMVEMRPCSEPDCDELVSHDEFRCEACAREIAFDRLNTMKEPTPLVPVDPETDFSSVFEGI